MEQDTMTLPEAHPWQGLSINAEQRSAIIRAMGETPQWDIIRAKYGCNNATLTKDQRLALCHEMGMDIPAIIGHTYQPPIETAKPVNMPAAVATAVAPGLSMPPVMATDPMQALSAAIAAIAGQAMNPAQIAAVVDQRINEALSNIPSIKIEVKTGDTTQEIEGHQHSEFVNLVKLASARQFDGFHPNVWISGPTGSGKTHAAKMLAKALGRDFSFHGAMSMAHELMGYKDAGGTYHATEFRRIFEHGGVILLDECDGYDSNATLALNAALANGMASFPDKLVPRHKDCVIIAAGNTWGNGATADYVGRAKIDAAFLSRFPVKIAWDYDLALEIALSGNEKWAMRVQNARLKAREKGLKVVIDPRQTYAGASLIANGMTMDQAAKYTYLAALTPEQRKMIGEA